MEQGQIRPKKMMLNFLREDGLTFERISILDFTWFQTSTNLISNISGLDLELGLPFRINQG